MKTVLPCSVALLLVAVSGCVVLDDPTLALCRSNDGCGGSEQCIFFRCRPPTCADGRIDGLETDVDCGGAHCAPCGEQALCLHDGDCQSRDCVDHRCVEPTCTDGLLNGFETDVDCGGAACPKCSLGAACELASDCVMGACADGHCSTTETGTCPGAICGGTCSDLRVDPLNCGRCGTVCPAPQACVAGQCASACLGGATSCGGTCVDTTSNPRHCGGCDRPCGAGATCVNSSCVPSCSPVQQLCNGRCVSVDRDPENCGQCGRVCPGSSACVGNQCVPACLAPLLVCGSACVDPRTDPMNCGGCNAPCMNAGNAVKGCFGAVCEIVGCAPGFDDCNGQPQDGCEADLGASPTDCGQCGRSCNGSQSCIAGACCEGGLPGGSYQATCRSCEACDGVLRCECRDSTSAWQPASFPLNPPCPNITNCNGVLQCNGC